MRRLQIKFPSQIRISGWDFGSSARAMNQAGGKDSLMTYESVPFTQAELRTVRRSTTERKKMSTKTSIKRIALVAVAALGLGMVTNVAANAGNIASSIFGSISLAKVTSTPTVGSAVDVNVGADVSTAAGESDSDTTTLTGYLSSYPAGGFAQVAASATAAGTDGELFTAAAVSEAASGASYTITFTTAANAAANDIAATSTAGAAKMSFTPNKAGDYVMTVWNDVDADGVVDIGEAVQTIAISVAAASTWSQALTTVHVANANANTLPTSSTYAVPVVKTLGTKAGVILITLRDALGSLYTGQTVTATVSGVGFVSGGSSADANADGATTGTEVDTADGTATTTRTVSVTDTTGFVAIGVWGDGIAGTATVSLSVTDKVSGATTVIGSKEFTFYGAKAAISLSESNYKIGRAGGYNTGFYTTMATRDTAAKVPAVVVKVADASGQAVAGSTVSATSSDLNVIASATCAEDDNNADYGSGGSGYFNCYFTTATSAKSGDKATITFKTLDAAGTAYLTVDYAVTVGGSVAKEVLSVDSTSYEAGASMAVTITATDASGNPVYDGAATPTAITANKSVIGLPTSASVYVAGKKTWSTGVYAPATSGNFALSATGTDTALTVITTSAAVESDGAADAANEATDAANAATDAANAAAEAADAATAAAQDAQAAVAALATQVASLIAGIKAQITTLTNLVIKIQKKVKA